MAYKESISRIIGILLILAAIAGLFAAMFFPGTPRKLYHWTRTPSQPAAAPVSEDHIRSLLARVQDTELGVNIVDLGLIYGIQLTGSGAVEVTMTLTTPYCPYTNTIIEDIRKLLMADPAISDAQLRIVFDPPWSWERVDKSVRNRMIERFSAFPAKTGSRND